MDSKQPAKKQITVVYLTLLAMPVVLALLILLAALIGWPTLGFFSAHFLLWWPLTLLLLVPPGWFVVRYNGIALTGPFGLLFWPTTLLALLGIPYFAVMLFPIAHMPGWL